MTDHLIPRAPKRKKQPTADKLREQLALAADEIIRLRSFAAWCGVTVIGPNGEEIEATHVGVELDPVAGIVKFSGEFPPPSAPWWRRLLQRISP